MKSRCEFDGCGLFIQTFVLSKELVQVCFLCGKQMSEGEKVRGCINHTFTHVVCRSDNAHDSNSSEEDGTNKRGHLVIPSRPLVNNIVQVSLNVAQASRNNKIVLNKQRIPTRVSKPPGFNKKNQSQVVTKIKTSRASRTPLFGVTLPIGSVCLSFY